MTATACTAFTIVSEGEDAEVIPVEPTMITKVPFDNMLRPVKE